MNQPVAFILQATTRNEWPTGSSSSPLPCSAARWRLDFEIPLKHGAKQVLGENGGPGGLFHAMRNIPIILDICRDIERLCPDALVLNFSNPEGRLCLAATRHTALQVVGLCHGIGMAQHAISEALGLPIADVDPKAAGLNHFTWILDLRHAQTGEDLYPALRRAVADWQGDDLRLTRFMMQTFGYWPSCSDDHIGEYLAYAWDNRWGGRIRRCDRHRYSPRFGRWGRASPIDECCRGSARSVRQIPVYQTTSIKLAQLPNRA